MTSVRESSALKIIACLRRAGYRAYFAGGCVRDRLLGTEPSDYDIVTDAVPDEIRSQFPRSVSIGADFGRVLVLQDTFQFDVSSLRGSSQAPTHSADVSDVLRADAALRDFTINAMVADPETNQVYDFMEGRKDLQHKLIRAVGDPVERFTEDPLRMIRAVRLAAQLDFTIEAATQTTIRARAAEILLASPERIRMEILGILLSPLPALGFRLLAETGLLPVVLPEVAAMQAIPQPPEFHPEGDVWTHTLLMLEQMGRDFHSCMSPGGTQTTAGKIPSASIQASGRPGSPELALAVLLHDVGKPQTYRVAERIRFEGHAEIGAKLVTEIAHRYRWSAAQTERVRVLVRDHLVFSTVRQMKRSSLVRWLRKAHFPELLALHRLDCLGSHRSLDAYEFCRKELAPLTPAQTRPARLLTGKDLKALGYLPGPRYKEILSAVEDAQLEGRLATNETARAWVRARFPLSM
jgi:putative nucleotidyltransferase with HDIG domain